MLSCILLRLGVFCPVLTLLSLATMGQESFPPRQVLGIRSQSDEFKRIVDRICNPATDMMADTQLKRSGVYFRLTEKKYILQAGQLNLRSALGGSPYVFLTAPEAAFGRSLYGIYSDLGYGAESILKQRNRRMVALVLRYPTGIRFSGERGGQGPLAGDEYDQFIYVPTWKNAFALLARLAGDPSPDPKNPRLLQFSDEAERNLARYYPAERRDHIEKLPHTLLRIAGGPDWEYRKLLETKMGMNSHFRGVGLTENTLNPADTRKGLPEWIGPNRKLEDLVEYAVIDMGRLAFVELHDVK